MSRHITTTRRALAALLALWTAASGCRPSAAASPRAGVPQRERVGLVAVPGGAVNAAGGNLIVERVDISVDTLLGTRTIGATYNSRRGDWLWSFQISYDGETFVDPTGAAFDVGGLPDGAAIPGTVWVRHSASEIATRGGLLYAFDAEARLSQVRWKTLDYPRIAYGATAEDALTVEQCTAPGVCAPLFVIELAGGAPQRVVGARAGRTVEYDWDGGRLVGVRDPVAVASGAAGTRYEYHALFSGLLTAIETGDGERTEYDYQAGARIWQVVRIGEGDPTDRFEFYAPASYADEFTTVHTNPLGGRTRYAFDGLRRLRSVERLDSAEVETLEWAGERPSRIVAAEGAVTEYAYTGDDPSEIVQPSGNVVSISYAPGALSGDDPEARPVAQIADSLGLVEARSYGPDGRLASVANGEGETTGSTWSPVALASLTLPGGATFGFPVRGVHGHWLEMDGAAEDRRRFDAVGNPLIASAGRQPGGLLARSWDADRRVAALGVAGSDSAPTAIASIALARRGDGQVAAVVRPGGGDHVFGFDALGRVVSRSERVDGGWQVTRFEYDAMGNRTALERPNGMREEIDYDVYGRRVAHRALRDGVLKGEATWTWRDGHVESETDSLRGTAEHYGYDAAGRLTSVGYGFGESVVAEYDLRSRRAAETLYWPGLGAIRRIEYAYDLADRITRLGADGGEALVEWDYADGAVAEKRFGNGLTRRFEPDPASGAWVAAETTDAAGAVIASTRVDRSVETNPLREQVRTSTATSLAETVERYTLHRGGHLAGPDGFMGQRVFAWDDEAGAAIDYAYDALGNRVSGATGDSFVYNDEGSRLLSATLSSDGLTIDYTYDAAGFAVSRGNAALGWTATGRLASIDSPAGSDWIDWDMRGRPIAMSIGGAEVAYTAFGGRVPSDPQTGALGALDLGAVSVAFDATGRTWRHEDFRHNVSFVSDETGSVVAHYGYSAYGVDAAFGASADAVAFAGGPRLGDLVWLGERIYDPAVGRFLSPDPVFSWVNQYTYTLGNPLRYWDPDGRQASAMPPRQQVRTVLEGAAIGLFLAAALGCEPCGIVAIGIVAALYIDEVWRGGAIDIGSGAAGPQLPGAPSCGLIGIEPWLVLALCRRRRRRRRRATEGGNGRW